jgi:hypothetical protein
MRFAGVAGGLQLQESLFQLNTCAAGVSADRSSAGNDAVAGNQNRNGVGRHRAADGAGRTRFARSCSEIAIGRRLPIGNAASRLEHAFAEWCRSAQFDLKGPQVDRSALGILFEGAAQLGMPIAFCESAVAGERTKPVSELRSNLVRRRVSNRECDSFLCGGGRRLRTGEAEPPELRREDCDLHWLLPRRSSRA